MRLGIFGVAASLAAMLVVSSIRLESGLTVHFSPPAAASVSVQLAEIDDEQ
ncbi:TPA: hypothetical protein RLP78_004356 [Yersinia enterocolitica]|nr:hypothetical protein [Yersinia enterocolitica]